jgi:hypothetical protein
MSTKRARTVSSPSPDEAFAVLRPAAVVALGEDPTRIAIRFSTGGERTRAATARLALASPYRPAEGDRVLVAGSGDELYVIGVLHTSTPQAVPLPDGGSFTLHERAAEIRDAAGRLLVRYEGGRAEIAAPTGDLTLSAPEGNIVLRSGKDIRLDASGTAAIGAGLEEGASPQLRIGAAVTRITAERLEVKADESRVHAGQATVIADRISTTANAVIQTVERFELTATRLVERTRDTFREASDLAETRAGRARTLVKDVYSLFSRRTTLASTEDTSIDGSKILLG